MYTDLFLSLKDPDNARGNPSLAALLYAFCPAASRWWLAGADPVLPFDPVWQALSDRSTGITLKDALTGYGFDSLTLAAKEYVDQVDAFRRAYPGITAPELMPTFSGGQTSVRQRYGHQDAINKLGSDWHNFFVYTRAWVFLVGDWERKAKFLTPPKLSPIRLAFTLPGVRRTVYFPAWKWVENLAKKTRTVIGLLTSDSEQDQLRFALTRQSGSDGEKPWPSSPEIIALNRITGETHSAFSRLEEQTLPGLVLQLAKLAENGPHPPLRALQRPDECLAYCGYSAQCFTGKPKLYEISALALGIDV